MSVTKLKSFCGAVWMFIQILGAACVTTFFEALSYVFIRPFSLPKHRQICIFFTRSFFLCSTALLEDWANISFKAYGDCLDPKKTCLVLVNHRSDIDWLLGLAFLARFGRPFPGNAKSVTKASLGKVPILGSTLRFAEFLFLTRDWARDRKKFLADLLALRNYSECGHSLWFVLYPEGTRFTEEKKEYSRAYAEKINRRAPENVLFPRFKAFVALLTTLRGTIDGVVDASFMFSGGIPSLKGVLAATDSTVVHTHAKYYAMKDIPEGEEQLQEWLLEKWYEKDRRIEDFNRDVSTLGSPNTEFFPTNDKPSAKPFYVLSMVFNVVSVITIYLLSRTQHGLAILFTTSAVAISMTVVFVLLNLRPSKKGSGRSHGAR